MNRTHSISNEEWEDCKKYFNYECAYCGLSVKDHYITFNEEERLGDFHKEHVDHEGENDLSNCVPSCKSCNSRKWEHDFNEWYTENNEVYSIERLSKIIKWLEEDCFKFMKIN